MTEPAEREHLHAKLDRLGEPEVAVVGRVVDACLVPVGYDFTNDTWLTAAGWGEVFQTRIRAHHALNPEPMLTSAFEAAFNAACDAVGWRAVPAPSATHRFFDTTVTIPGGEPLRISLKSSAARDMKTDRVHISKLTEAAWIQDARTQSARRKHIVDLFRDYRATTDLIMMVRCFSIENGDRYQYELVEIPTSLFASVDLVDIELAQKSTIGIPPGAKPPEAKIRVDRSDAKITLTDIRLDLCVVHGRWTVENLSGCELTPEA